MAAISEDQKVQAQANADALAGAEVTIKVAVSEEETMYGPIGTREIEDAYVVDLEIDKSQVQLPDGPLKDFLESIKFR